MAQEIIFRGSLVGVSPARYWGPANSPLKVFTAILRRGGACLSCPWTYLLKSAITPPGRRQRPIPRGEINRAL